VDKGFVERVEELAVAERLVVEKFDGAAGKFGYRLVADKFGYRLAVDKFGYRLAVGKFDGTLAAGRFDEILAVGKFAGSAVGRFDGMFVEDVKSGGKFELVVAVFEKLLAGNLAEKD
jgi:hypothetical protein